MDLGLDAKVFVVTGASRGLGRSVAQALVDEGANVVVAARGAEALATCVAELGEDRAAGIPLDNADPAAAKRLSGAALDRFGQLDGLVVSVGGPPPGAVMGRTDAQWRTSFETVFLGALRLATGIADRLGEGGSILFVLSTSVKEPIDGLAISNGLRPGLAMAAKTLADELGPRGIRVNGVLPGRIETDRVRELDAAAGDPAAVRSAHEARIPLRRYGSPEEFGRVAAFLLSPAASFVTGVMLAVDGGLTRSL